MNTLLVLAMLELGCKKAPPPPVVVPPKVEQEVVKKDIPKPLPPEVVSMVQNFQRVFFEVDSDVLSPDAKGALDENVTIMQKNPSIKIEIQGHADERGTTQHNLALGEKRGKSVSRYLEFQGISKSRIKVVSYGEEKPLAVGNNENVWSRNRRCEFVITWKNEQAPVQGTAEPE